MIKITERVELLLGCQCNARCRFCYSLESVKNNRQDAELSTKEVKRILRYIRKKGITEVEFTGGEPTIREDLPRLVSFAKSLGFVNISMITNGLRLSRFDYAKQLVEAGVNDFIFSIHGHTEALHDYQTQIHGSYDQLMVSIHNIKKLGVRFRSNTVINGLNYRYATEIMKHLIELDMKSIYFVFFNPVGEASEAEKEVYVKYSEAVKYVVKAIDLYEERLPCFNVKYIPFCFLKGYEKYVMNTYQQNFDPDEWNLYISFMVSQLRFNFFHRLFSTSRTIVQGLTNLKDFTFPLKYGWYGLKMAAITRYMEMKDKKCLKVCHGCSYYNVCDYLWMNYYLHYGEDGVEPIKGPGINNPVWSYVAPAYRVPGDVVTSDVIT